MAERTCGECARFKVPGAGCPSIESFSEYVDGRPLMDAHCAACSEFHQARKARDKKTKKQMKDSGTTVDGCFEAIYHDNKPCFLVGHSDSFSIVESLEIDEQVFYPKEAKHIPYWSYGYFEGTVPNREDLYWKVREELRTFVDVEAIWLDVLAACVLLSYQQEKLQTAPYIYLYGDNESGKSTVLQLLNILGYRPMYAVTVPSADIYGYLEASDGIGCILEDEVQGIQKDTDKIKIYKAGYKQGAVVPRTILTRHDRIIKYFPTFCFKACASEQLPQVKGFNERFLFVPMVEGSPEKEWADITKEDLDRLHDLRNMLLKWRMQSKDWQLPEVQMFMKGRLKELWKPILQITHGLTVYDGLFKLVEDQKNERLSTKQNTLEGHIVKVVSALYDQQKKTLSFSDIWRELVSDLEGKLDDKKPHVMDTSEFFQVTKNKIGYRLREILSGKTTVLKERDQDGNRVSIKAYAFDEDKLERVVKKYGYSLSTESPSAPTSEGVHAPESMERTALNNVENTPQELSKLSNLVDKQTEPPNTAIEDSSIPENSEEKSVTRNKDPNLVESKSSVKEALEFVRSRFVEGTQEEWVGLAVAAGLPEKEAEALFESLKGSELFWLDRPDGKTVWRWVKQ